MTDIADPKSPWIVETDEANFERDVFERSKQTPVVVDFWATWCAPCRMLGPVLEQITNEYAGKFILVKADTDQVPRAAGEFNVQGIPAVYAVCGGEVVDFFSGALPPAQVRQWLDRVLIAADVSAAQQLEATDPRAAETKYRAAIEQAPNNFTASIGLARVLVATARTDEAREILDRLASRGFLEPEAEAVKAALQLKQFGDIDLDAARSRAEAHPGDLEAQLKLAEALAARGEFVASMDVCLKIVEQDKAGVGVRARQMMVDLLRVVPDEELVRDYRRKLSLLLY